MAKRRKKARKKTAQKCKRISVSRCALVKVIHLGASHHAALASLKKTVRAGMVGRKKARKKTAKKARRRRVKR